MPWPPAPPLPPTLLRIGSWRVEPAADEISQADRVVKLEPVQMKLLLALAARPGQVVTTQDLLDSVWRDVVVTQNSVYQAVAQLRRQLGDTADEPQYIQTVHRKGYRLLAAVAAVAAEPTAAATAGALAHDAVESSAASATLGAAPVGLAEAQPAPPAPSSTLAMPRRRRTLGLALAVALPAAGAAAGWWVWRRHSPAEPVRLAVLPFTDRTPGGGEGALARGLAQDVARALGQHESLRLVAPDLLLERELGDTGDIAATAQRLGVRYLLQGELVRAGSRLRLRVQLRTGAEDVPVWEEGFDQATSAVSQLPLDVASRVSAALAIAPAAQPKPAAGQAEAYELFVLGTDALRPKTPEAFAKARDYFRRGIDADPSYARNHVGLGWTWLGQASTGAGMELPRAVAVATPSFERALRLDPTLPEALTGKAELHGYAGEYETARALLQRALAANPNYAQAHHSLGTIEFNDGRPLAAIAHFQRAAVLNPLSASPLDRLAVSQAFAGLPAANDSARRAIALDPGNPNGHWVMGIAAWARGDLVQGVGAYRAALEREPRRPYLWGELGRMYLDLELPDEAARAFARCEELLPGVPWAAVQTAWAWLARAERGAMPALLATQPDDASVAEWSLMRTMAGAPPTAPMLQAALDTLVARGADRDTPIPWFLFIGHHRPLDMATVLTTLGRPADAAPRLALAQAQLDMLERNGNRWPMLPFHRARLLALRQQPMPAMESLKAAVAGGARRAWWLRLDPAFAELRSEPRFQALLAELSAQLATQRRQLGF